MQRIKKTARIAALEGKPVRDEVRRGVRAYRATKHATTGVSPNNLMFGRQPRGKFPEVNRQHKHQNDKFDSLMSDCDSTQLYFTYYTAILHVRKTVKSILI